MTGLAASQRERPLRPLYRLIEAQCDRRVKIRAGGRRRRRTGVLTLVEHFRKQIAERGGRMAWAAAGKIKPFELERDRARSIASGAGAVVVRRGCAQLTCAAMATADEGAAMPGDLCSVLTCPRAAQASAACPPGVDPARRGVICLGHMKALCGEL